MSFALTTDQVRAHTKTVTRRLGWRFAQPGDVVQPVIKSQGLTKGETVQKIGLPIRIVSVRREQIGLMMLKSTGKSECRKEGFPHLSPRQFVEMFCRHNRCEVTAEITRIEFEYGRNCAECGCEVAPGSGLCGECSCEDDCAP